ncbi:MAG: tRNA pseudouridine(38-40) synthase TruA [Bdellovibrionales bacterium]
MRIRLDISYDGTDYIGWQIQPLPQPTVQIVLQDALKKLFPYDIKTCGSGRTDTGVHAKHQVVQFDLPDDLDLKRYKVATALNSILPSSICVQKASIAPKGWHVLHGTKEKTYIYRLYTSAQPNALLDRFTTRYTYDFNMELIQQYSKYILGEHDFKSFQSAGTVLATTVRKVLVSEWRTIEDGIYEYKITGTGFLKQMVRNLVGTMLELQRQNTPPEEMKNILLKLDRTAAGPTAPARGLRMEKVSYSDEFGFTPLK